MQAPQDRTTPGLFTSLFRYRWTSLAIIALITLLSGGFGYLTQQPATAKATIALKSPSQDDVLTPGVVGDASTTRYIEQRAQFATNDAVLGEVAGDVGATSISKLREQITVKPVTGTNTMVVTAQGATANDAVTLANATVAAYRSQSAALADQLRAKAADELSASQQAVRTAAGNKADPLSQAASSTLADLQRQGAQLRVTALVFGDGVDFVNSARVEDATVPGAPLRDIAVGFVLGLAAAAVVAWVRADRDRRIVDANRPVAILDAPLLGVIQKQDSGTLVTRLASPSNAKSNGTLATLVPSQYHLVGTALMRRALLGVVAVIGPPPAHDRWDSVLNVAVALAADGARVLVIDADPAGTVSKQLKALDDSEPPTDQDNPSDGPSRIQVRADVELFLLSPGSGSEPSTGPAAREFAEKVLVDREKYDMIIVDTPSIDTTPLAPALMRISTGILAVVPRGCDESSISEIKRTAEVYSTPLLGFVYTGARGIG